MKEQIKEKLLLYRLQSKKDPEAFAALYDIYITRIYRFVFFKVRTREEAEEITSDVFLKAWNYVTAKESQEIRNFNALLYRMARNTVIDYYRAQKKKMEEVSIHKDDGTEISLPLHVQQNFSMTFQDNDAGMIVERHMKKLKDDYKEIITLRYIDEISLKDISRILDQSEVGVRVKLHRAKKALRRIIEQKKSKA